MIDLGIAVGSAAAAARTTAWTAACSYSAGKAEHAI